MPLTDADRAPWLAAVRARVRRQLDTGATVVLACSALKQAYRDYLERVDDRVVVVQLTAAEAVVRARLLARRAHFLPAVLLDSQYEALESDDDAIVINASAPVDEVVAAVRAQLGV